MKCKREVYEKAVTERLTTTITKVDDVIVRQADEFAEKVIQKSVGAETAAVETTEVAACAGEITQAAKQSKGFYNLVRAVEGESGISAAAKKKPRGLPLMFLELPKRNPYEAEYFGCSRQVARRR